jgi:hypothetical protein
VLLDVGGDRVDQLGVVAGAHLVAAPQPVEDTHAASR